MTMSLADRDANAPNRTTRACLVLSTSAVLLSVPAFAENERMYIVEPSFGRVAVADTDGSNFETVIFNAVHEPGVVASDWLGGQVYWHWGGCDRSGEGSQLYRSDLDGDHSEMVMQEYDGSYGLTIDPVGGRMYYTSESRIQSRRLDGTDMQIVATTQNTALSVAVSPFEEWVYWTERQGRVMRADYDGSNQIVLLAGGAPKGIAVDIDNAEVFVTLGGDRDRTLVRMNSDGSNPRIVRANATMRSYIAVDPGGHWVYYAIRNDPKCDAGTSALYRSSPDGSVVEKLYDFLGTSHIGLDPLAGRLFIASGPHGQYIAASNLDGSEAETIVRPVLFEPEWIEMDEPAGKMYWSESDRGRIRRADLDGSSIETVLVGPDFGPGSMALDGLGHIYWLDETNDAIRRCDLDGSNLVTVQELRAGNYGGLAVACDHDYLFYSQLLAGIRVTHRIWRSRLDGSDSTLIFDSEYSHNPYDFFVDQESSTLYWSSNASSVTWAGLFKINFEGEAFAEIVVERSAIGMDVNLDSREVWWVNTFTDEIRKASLDGGEPHTLLAGPTVQSPRYLRLVSQQALTPCLDLAVPEVMARGEEAQLTITGGTPGDRCVLVYGFDRGSTLAANQFGYCADFAIADVTPSRLIGGEHQFDGDGQAIVSVRIPDQAGGLRLQFQAALRGTCPDSCMSYVVSRRIR